MLDEATALFESITAYDKACEGDSNEAEIDAAEDLREAALAFVRKVAERDIPLAEMLDEFERRARNVWEDDAI